MAWAAVGWEPQTARRLKRKKSQSVM
jgi:hypothetical protein